MPKEEGESLEAFIERLKEQLKAGKAVPKTVMAEHGMLERVIAKAINGQEIELCVSCGTPNMYQVSSKGNSKYEVYRCEKCMTVVYRADDEFSTAKPAGNGGFAHHAHTPRGDYFW